MKKWYEKFELVKFSILTLMVASILSGIGSIKIENDFIQQFINIIGYSGNMLFQFFPLSLVINYLGKANKDIITVVSGILCYLLFNVITMFLSAATLPAEFYTNVCGLSYNTVNIAGLPVVYYPINLGIISSVIAIVIVNFIYRLSRKRYNYGVLRFIDNDAFFLVLSLLLTAVAAEAVCVACPYLVAFFMKQINFISQHNSNPAMYFVYGVLEKGFNVLSMGDIMKQNFLFGQLGGSLTIGDRTIYGDFNIWQIQADTLNATITAGRYMTAEYIINIFTMPGILLALYLSITDKIEREKNAGLLVFAIIVCVFTGNILPIEFYLLICAPMVFFGHVLATGLIYMVVNMKDLLLGSFSTNVGNLFDLIRYFRATEFNQTAKAVVMVGVVCFALYFIIASIYYRIMAYNFLDNDTGKILYKRFIVGLGGMHNIKMINSGINTVIVVLNNKEQVIPQELIDAGAIKVRERYFGYVIEYGPGSFMLVNKIKKELEIFKECLKLKTN